MFESLKNLNAALKKSEDIIPGGKGDKKPDSAFKYKDLIEGIKEEMEHTTDKAVAKEIAKDHLTEDPDYYKKLKKLHKAIVDQAEAGIAINTAEESLDEMASKEYSEWIDLITKEVWGLEYGEVPKEIAFPYKKALQLVKVDEGVFSGFLKNDDPDNGEYGQVLMRFEKVSIPSIVQAMKVKGYIPRKQEEEEEPETEAGSKFKDLASALKDFSGEELHIHIHED